MDLKLKALGYKFKTKPLLVGGKAKEFYGIRKSGPDTDLIVTSGDYNNLSKLYPNNLADLWGDLGVKVKGFEIWKTILLFDYEFLSKGAIEKKDHKIIFLEKLLFLTSLAIKKPKYLKDTQLIVKKILEIQYKDFDSSRYEK